MCATGILFLVLQSDTSLRATSVRTSAAEKEVSGCVSGPTRKGFLEYRMQELTALFGFRLLGVWFNSTVVGGVKLA